MDGCARYGLRQAGEGVVEDDVDVFAAVVAGDHARSVAPGLGGCCRWSWEVADMDALAGAEPGLLADHGFSKCVSAVRIASVSAP